MLQVYMQSVRIERISTCAESKVGRQKFSLSAGTCPTLSSLGGGKKQLIMKVLH